MRRVGSCIRVTWGEVGGRNDKSPLNTGRVHKRTTLPGRRNTRGVWRRQEGATASLGPSLSVTTSCRRSDEMGCVRKGPGRGPCRRSLLRGLSVRRRRGGGGAGSSSETTGRPGPPPTSPPPVETPTPVRLSSRAINLLTKAPRPVSTSTLEVEESDVGWFRARSEVNDCGTDEGSPRLRGITLSVFLSSQCYSYSRSCHRVWIMGS